MNASELRFRCAVAEQWRRLSSGAIPAGESLVGQTRPSSSLVAQVECYDFLTEYLNLKYLLRGQQSGVIAELGFPLRPCVRPNVLWVCVRLSCVYRSVVAQ